MAGFKKVWTVRSYPEAVARLVKCLPRVYEDACSDGVVGWVGRTFAHQRKDFRPKAPQLAVEKEHRLVFQHDLVTAVTYTLELEPIETGTRVALEVRAAGVGKDTGPTETILTLIYALTKALEPVVPAS